MPSVRSPIGNELLTHARKFFEDPDGRPVLNNASNFNMIAKMDSLLHTRRGRVIVVAFVCAITWPLVQCERSSQDTPRTGSEIGSRPETPRKGSKNKESRGKDLSIELVRKCTTATDHESHMDATKKLIIHLQAQFSAEEMRKDPQEWARLMHVWNPIYFNVNDLISVAGPPTEKSSELLRYVVITNGGTTEWSFKVVSSTIQSVECSSHDDAAMSDAEMMNRLQSLNERFDIASKNIGVQTDEVTAYAFLQLMKEWNAVGYALTDLTTLVGQPFEETSEYVEYRFYAGGGGITWRFKLRDKRIVGVEALLTA